MNTQINFLLIVDGEPVYLSTFLDANTNRVDPDISSLSDEDINAVKNLKPGEKHLIPVHFGYCTVIRSSAPFIVPDIPRKAKEENDVHVYSHEETENGYFDRNAKESWVNERAELNLMELEY